MGIRFSCPNGHKLHVKNFLAGKRGVCPECGVTVDIPAVGIHRQPDGSFLGDVVFDDAKERAGAITPVPGGVGPMTVACLLENTLQAAEIQDQKIEVPDVTNV